MNQALRKDAQQILASSLQAVLPDEAVQRALRDFEPHGGRVLLVAAGKAAWQMAAAAPCLKNLWSPGQSCRTSPGSCWGAGRTSWR